MCPGSIPVVVHPGGDEYEDNRFIVKKSIL
jgi:hypothetical protein